MRQRTAVVSVVAQSEGWETDSKWVGRIILRYPLKEHSLWWHNLKISQNGFSDTVFTCIYPLYMGTPSNHLIIRDNPRIGSWHCLTVSLNSFSTRNKSWWWVQGYLAKLQMFFCFKTAYTMLSFVKVTFVFHQLPKYLPLPHPNFFNYNLVKRLVIRVHVWDRRHDAGMGQIWRCFFGNKELDHFLCPQFKVLEVQPMQRCGYKHLWMIGKTLVSHVLWVLLNHSITTSC